MSWQLSKQPSSLVIVGQILGVQVTRQIVLIATIVLACAPLELSGLDALKVWATSSLGHVAAGAPG